MKTFSLKKIRADTAPVKIAPIGIANLGWKFYIIFVVMTFIQLPIGICSSFLITRARLTQDSVAVLP